MAGSNASLMGPSNCGIKHDDQTYGVDYGPNVPSTCYFTVMADASHFNYVTVDGTPAANNVMMQQHQLAVTGFKEVSPFPGVTAFGGAVTRASGALGMWNGNHLVWSRTGMCGTDICARVFDVDTQAGSLKNYDFTVAGSSMWSATVGLDSSNNIFTLIAQTSSTIPISLAVGGVSASGAVIKPQIVQQGNGAFPADQFGDFFASSQDPVDGSVWAVGNYASGSNKCGARVVHIVAK
jgi:hypothetical protein